MEPKTIGIIVGSFAAGVAVAVTAYTLHTRRQVKKMCQVMGLPTDSASITKLIDDAHKEVNDAYDAQMN
jgi:hypothetical protein